MKLSSSKIIKRVVAEQNGGVPPFFDENQFTSRDRVEQLVRDAQELIESARQEAACILSQAKQEALLEQQSGFEEGVRSGLEKMAAFEETLVTLIEEVSNVQTQTIERLEGDVVRLAMKIAGKIIHEKIETEEDFVIGTVRDVCREVSDKESIVLKVSPCDVAILEEFQPKMLERFHDIKRLEIISDATVGKGGCIIETKEGLIDATIKTQLRQLYRVIDVEEMITEDVHGSIS